MSGMMNFDTSKIEEMKRKREEGLPYISEDVVEASKNARGGSELIYERIKDRMPEDLWDYFQVILSRVRELEDKPRILWFQDTSKFSFSRKKSQEINLSVLYFLPIGR